MYRFLSIGFFVLAASQSVASAPAFAQTDPCGNFNFDLTSGLDCKVEVEGGCTAQCTPLRFEAACTGHCGLTAESMCVDTCGTQCIATCDPSLLDCFAGCHAECDGPVRDQCEKSGGEDCQNVAVAQCDIHCKESCEVPPSNCQEHCTSCCTGSCTTQVNFDCNLDCFAELSGGCEAQCTEPSGALFCNGQYIGASDVQACIAYLATQGVQVDVTAQGEVTCGLDGCEGEGSIGCRSVVGRQQSKGLVVFLLACFALLAVRRTRRHVQRKTDGKIRA